MDRGRDNSINWKWHTCCQRDHEFSQKVSWNSLSSSGKQQAIVIMPMTKISLVLRGADQFLTSSRHWPNILVAHGMSQLDGAECNSKGTDSHYWVSTRITDPVLEIEVTSPALYSWGASGGFGANLTDGISPVKCQDEVVSCVISQRDFGELLFCHVRATCLICCICILNFLSWCLKSIN